MEDIDAALGIGHKAPQEKEIDVIALQLFKINEQIEQLKVAQRALEDKIWTQTVEEEGEVVLSGDRFDAVVTRKKSEKWDSDVLESLLPTQPLPDYVKMKLSIDNKKYKALPQSEQLSLLPALTVGVTKPKVTIKPKNGVIV